MPNRNEIVAHARTFEHVPYRHQGRNRFGMDCSGLVMRVGLDFGLLQDAIDLKVYSRFPDGHTFKTQCDKGLVYRGDTLQRVAHGSVGLFWVSRRKYPQHVGIFWFHENAPATPRLIHAYQDYGEVRDGAVTDFWAKRLVAVYDFPGVT